MVLPTAVEGVSLVVRYEERLRALGYRLLDYAGDTSLAMLDKDRTYALAREIGVDCPRTWPARDEDDLRAIADELSFPCALKPVVSHLFAKHFKGKVLLANDLPQLVAGLTRTRAAGVEMLVTEIVTGPDDHNWAFRTYLDASGRPLFAVTTKPPALGADPLRVELLPRYPLGPRGRRGRPALPAGRRAARARLHRAQARRPRRAAEAHRVQPPLRQRAGGRPPGGHRRGAPRLPAGAGRADAARRRLEGGGAAVVPASRPAGRKAYRRHGELTWPRWLASLLRPDVHVPVLALDDLRPTAYQLWSRNAGRLRPCSRQEPAPAPAPVATAGSPR